MSWVDETSLNATSIPHFWKRVTPGPESTLQHEKRPAYPFPPGSRPGQGHSGAASSLCRAEQPWATCQHEAALKAGHCSLGWTWALRSRRFKWALQTQCICNLRPSCCQHVLTEKQKNFFSLVTFKIVLQSNPHNFIPWCYSLTDNIENLIDVGLSMPFKFYFT